MPPFRRFTGPCLAAAAAAVLTAGPADAATLRLACSSVGIELELCRSGAAAWAEETGHEVVVVSTPNSATERLALYQQFLSTGTGDIDVYQIDVIWPGLLGSHFVDLSEHVPADEIAAHLPAIVENNTVDGELKAMPWFVDVGLLYYRSDLLDEHGLAVPESWAALTEAAATVQAAERAAGDDRFWGWVWQGRAEETLTCNALEWLASAGAGRVVSPAGRITVDDPDAAAMLELAESWVGEISPPGVLNYAEEDARGLFQSGSAAFMRNWPYAWALANAPDSPVAGRVGVAPLPRGDGPDGRHAATLGGQQLAVSRQSANVALAADLVRHLTGPEEQRRRALEGSFNPTIPALYDDPALLDANPFLAEILGAVEAAVARPSAVAGERYNEVSALFHDAVHRVLSGEAAAPAALAELETELLRLSRGGRW
jgi:trehalose/maltose transport system substrate-binding protein